MRFARIVAVAFLAVNAAVNATIAGDRQSVAGDRQSKGPVLAALGEIDITPTVGGKRSVFIGGYGFNRRARGVHDPLFARAVVLQVGDAKIALVSVDLVVCLSLFDSW